MSLDDTCGLLCLDAAKAEALRQALPPFGQLEQRVNAAGALSGPTAAGSRSRNGGELCGCDLAFVIGRPDKFVSHHLGLLRSAGLAGSRKDGRLVLDALTDAGGALLEAVRPLPRRFVRDRGPDAAQGAGRTRRTPRRHLERAAAPRRRNGLLCRSTGQSRRRRVPTHSAGRSTPCAESESRSGRRPLRAGTATVSTRSALRIALVHSTRPPSTTPARSRRGGSSLLHLDYVL